MVFNRALDVPGCGADRADVLNLAVLKDIHDAGQIDLTLIVDNGVDEVILIGALPNLHRSAGHGAVLRHVVEHALRNHDAAFRRDRARVVNTACRFAVADLNRTGLNRAEAIVQLAVAGNAESAADINRAGIVNFTFADNGEIAGNRRRSGIVKAAACNAEVAADVNRTNIVDFTFAGDGEVAGNRRRPIVVKTAAALNAQIAAGVERAMVFNRALDVPGCGADRADVLNLSILKNIHDAVQIDLALIIDSNINEPILVGALPNLHRSTGHGTVLRHVVEHALRY